MSGDLRHPPAASPDPEEADEKSFSLLNDYWEALNQGEDIDPEAWRSLRPEAAEVIRDLDIVAQLHEARLRIDEDSSFEPPRSMDDPVVGTRGGPKKITLRVIAGPHKGRVFTFGGHDTFLVGRSKRAHFRLATKDKYFSRIHFMVEVNPPYCRLMDMGSRNGTYVNDKKVSQVDLKAGDRIKAGRTTLQLIVKKSRSTSVPVALPFRAPPTRFTNSPSRAFCLDTTIKWCRACRGPVSPPADRNGLGLCPGCQDKIRTHPQPIPGYQVIRELGRGSMGVVRQAVRSEDGAVVALKTITPAVALTPTDMGRFQREAAILYELDHPNIVALREIGEANGKFFFAMDYVFGTDAGRLVKKHGPMSVKRAVSLVCQLLQALDYAHAKRFVHRDIKPSNLLVRQDDDGETALLADFGLARVYQASRISGLTLLGDIGGTVPFMAPEQITDFRNVKPTVDQYGAGATLYTLLTGRFIYDFPPQDEKRLLMILQDRPIPIESRRPEILAELAAIIHRALAKDPKDRFADAKAMRKALLKFGR